MADDQLKHLAENVLAKTRSNGHATKNFQIDVVDAADYPGAAAAIELPPKTTFRKLSVLMPIYNERWTLPKIVARVLSSPVPLEIELIAVDDASTDGSGEVIEQLAAAEPRIRVFRHAKNYGKGAAIRTAIEHLTGDVAVAQDADLEYDPTDYPALLRPILEDNADAVFGSRFRGHTCRVLFFWHSLLNKALTLCSNMLNDLTLTDMETCYKMVRTDVLKQLRLSSNTFTIEPELTCRLAQWGARIYEVPVSYFGRTYQEGKKIRAVDGLKAIWAMFRAKFFDTQFTGHSGYYILSSVAKARNYNRWLVRQVAGFLGQRILEAGCGIGNLSSMLLDRRRLVLVDNEPMYAAALKRQFGSRTNVRVDQADLGEPGIHERWKDEQLDTIFCSNVLEHIESDDRVLDSFHQTLTSGGHCVVVVPAGAWLYSGMDRELGHHRRYTQRQLHDKMTAAGFDVVFTRQFCRFGSIGWAVSGRLLGRRHLSPRQMIWFDRLWPITKLLDRVLPVPGMSLVMVGRKR